MLAIARAILVQQKKEFSINFSKTKQNFTLVYVILLIIIICLLMEKKSLSLKLTIKVLSF